MQMLQTWNSVLVSSQALTAPFFLHLKQKKKEFRQDSLLNLAATTVVATINQFVPFFLLLKEMMTNAWSQHHATKHARSMESKQCKKQNSWTRLVVRVLETYWVVVFFPPLNLIWLQNYINNWYWENPLALTDVSKRLKFWLKLSFSAYKSTNIKKNPTFSYFLVCSHYIC